MAKEASGVGFTQAQLDEADLNFLLMAIRSRRAFVDEILVMIFGKPEEEKKLTPEIFDALFKPEPRGRRR